MNFKEEMAKKEERTGLIVFVIFILFCCFLIAGIAATNSGSSNSANLAIWDDTDGGESRWSLMNVYFNANYTNTTSSAINLSNGNGNCTIRFNESGEWTNWAGMLYNATSFLWQYNRSFNYKGVHVFHVNCTSEFGNVSIPDNFTISNTAPSISKDQGGSYIDIDGNKFNNDYLNCYEDSLCIYNFSTNVSEIDANDILAYGYSITSNTTLTNFTLNASTGILNINVTLDANTGEKKIELTVRDTESSLQSGILNVNITAVNDAPAFANLQNKTFNISELFEYIINITDEENNVPFVLGINFTSCSLAQWSSRTNCTLFTGSQYSFNSTAGMLNISFIPSRNDVGSYIINFSVMDNSSLGNKTTSQIVNFTVLNVNSAPYFTYICDNKRNATEDNEFTCWINASDIDETINLTFSANFSWFKFNSSGSNSISVACNSSTGYNASAMVNFTPTDLQVGNWSINITVTDIGGGLGAPKSNSSVIWFFINNTEDTVSLSSIANQTIYENKTIYADAIDNDLLVPDHSVKNEVLTFASNASWVSISSYSSSGNATTARIDINYDYIFDNQGAGNYTVRVNVTDTAGNHDERNFTITIVGDHAAEWNSSMADTFVLYEGSSFYINFSQNVSDADGDAINFSYSNDSAFPNFNLVLGSGVINFTPQDADVGYHNITVNASDGKLNSLKSFNFTVYNTNDAPHIEIPFQQSDIINASVDASSNITCTEDNYTILAFWVQDDDFKITQKSFYNESLVLNINISGLNATLLSFSKNPAFPTPGSNRSKYEALFIPKKSDVGSYNIIINISDASNSSDFISFNLVVYSIEHGPALANLANHTSSINRTFYYRINATDAEDGNSTTSGNSNFTFSYSFANGANIFNSTIFNSTTGEINITFNSSQGGKYRINITANDSSNRQAFSDFWIYVYDVPVITFPSASYSYNLTENATSNLTFSVNHSIGDNLTYLIYMEGSNSILNLKYNLSYYGNSTNLTWNFIPNFTDETYGTSRNISLFVFSPLFPDINASGTWNIRINHSNSPVLFSGHIGDYQSDYNNNILINLSNFFSDIDNLDSHYNQSISFNISSNASPSYISWRVSGFSLNLSSFMAVKELLNITARDLNGSNNSLTAAFSNNFQVEFTTPTSTAVSSPSSGGTSIIPVAFKIIGPSKLSAYSYQKIIIPLKLSNKGKKSFSYINLTSSAFKDGRAENKVRTSFDKSFFSSLDSGEEENATLTIYFETNISGDYEVLVNATSQSPKYNDWTKIQISLQKINESNIERLIVFTEELIAENPECIELKELLDEAKKDYSNGDAKSAELKAEKVISECRDSISQVSLPSMKSGPAFTINEYAIIASLVAVFIGISYYSLKRVLFNKKLGIRDKG